MRLLRGRLTVNAEPAEPSAGSRTTEDRKGLRVKAIVFPAAVVAGLIAGEVFRRSGSVWPAVVVRAVFNLPTPILMVLYGMG